MEWLQEMWLQDPGTVVSVSSGIALLLMVMAAAKLQK